MATENRAKTALVTGGNRGLGLVTARKLAEQGLAVVLTARTDAAGRAACDSIRAAVPGARVEHLVLDLSSLDSVRRCAAAFGQRPLHVLVENAGLMNTDERVRRTAEGFEITFATNHLGHFGLTHLLLPNLLRSAPSRIVVVASTMHDPQQGHGPGAPFDFDNLRAEKSFHPTVAYRHSKLANLWFTYELAPRLAGSGVTVNAVCPGFVPETVAEQMTGAWRRFFFRHVLARMPFARTPQQGAGNTVFAATDASLEGVTGRFIADRVFKESSAESHDREKALRLWESSCRWCGIERFGDPGQDPGRSSATAST